MKVRFRAFTSSLELNQFLKEHLEIFNNKVHRVLKRTSKEIYQKGLQYLRSLQVKNYKVATYHKALLCRDCHLMFDQDYYSAPNQHQGFELDIWATAKTVEIFKAGDRVAVYARGKTVKKFVTDPNHYPPVHQSFLEEDIQKIINQASKVGTKCLSFVKSLPEGDFPVKHMRPCQCIVALSWIVQSGTSGRVCKEANIFNNHNIQYLDS